MFHRRIVSGDITRQMLDQADAGPGRVGLSVVQSPCRALRRTGLDWMPHKRDLRERKQEHRRVPGCSRMFQPCVDMQIRHTTGAFLCSCDEELAQTPLTRVEAVTTARPPSCHRALLYEVKIKYRMCETCLDLDNVLFR
ncbi:hypothetical protein J3E69DRAFT_73288 [Trichoderma sp. SZMC 28015]